MTEMREVRSIERRSIDSLVQQLFDRIGGENRIAGPGEALSPLDERYVGVLKLLLQEAFPGTPEEVFSSVKDDLIVVSRAAVQPSELVSFTPSTLRVAPPYSERVGDIQNKYASLLNLTVLPTRYLDTDLMDPNLLFSQGFFSERSIKGWARLSLTFARLCASMQEMAFASGLKQEHVFHGGTSNLIPCRFSNRQGEEMELVAP